MPSARASRGEWNSHRLAVDEQLALVGLMRAGEDLDEARLARAVVAEDARDLAGVDVRRDVVERHDVAVVLAEAARFQQMVARFAHLDLAPAARTRMAALSMTASTRIAPWNAYTQLLSHCERMIPMLAMPRIAAPKAAPTTEP